MRILKDLGQNFKMLWASANFKIIKVQINFQILKKLRSNL
jgi:hypothetical protein